ncbi:hypothetical protein DFQ29_010002, partial [Apophysomyces sp. BC1021]
CYSNITKEFEDVDNQRVDFILSNVNDDNDYLSAEEKPSLKGVKNDMKKGKALQKAMLRKWTGHLGSVEIMNRLEAITCQWQGSKLTLNLILEAKYTHERESMYLSSDDETNFRPDSTAGLEHQEEILTIDA